MGRGDAHQLQGGRRPAQAQAHGAAGLLQGGDGEEVPEHRLPLRRELRERATWLETYAISGGTYSYGGYPDIDGLFREQAAELDRTKREAILHRLQQLVHERAMFAPIWDFGFLHGVGPRVEESGLGLLAGYGFSAPYEDVKLKPR
jgi:ABC-type transport system substrate-binding protein